MFNTNENVNYVDFEWVYTKECNCKEDDCKLKCYIDGYPSREDVNGTAIVVVSLTRHNDVVIDWHHNEYRTNKDVLVLIDDINEYFKKEIRKRIKLDK